MEFLTDLWLPILLSGVFVFVASSIVHMVLPYHKSDYKGLPGEAAILETMRGQNVTPGDYMFPHCESFKDLEKPENIERFKRGPVGTVTIIPSGPPTMAKALIQWFIFTLIMGLFVAYVTSLGLDKGADYRTVFQLSGAVATIGYGLGSFPNSIWKGVQWSTTAKFFVDGLIYGLITGGTFGWLWPAA